MLRTVRMLGLAGGVLFAQNALAELPFKAGDRELTFSGSLTQRSYTAELESGGGTLPLEDETSATFVVTGTYGWFLDERQEVGIITGVLWSDNGPGSQTSMLGGLSYDYHFPREGSTVVPVVGAAGRTIMFDAVSDYAIGISGGVRVMASPDVSVNVRAFYERLHAEESGFGGTVVSEADDIGVRAGFSWMLR